MAHIPYLTPSKICILALVELYYCNNVPEKATIPVLSFITSQLIPSSLASQAKDTESSNGKLMLDFEQFRDLLLTVDSATGFGSISHQRICNIPGDATVLLWEVFVKRMRENSNSLDAMVEYFKNLESMFDPLEGALRLSKTSLIGVFVRQTLVEFEKLRFSDAMKLWQAFRIYIHALPNDVIVRIEDEYGAACGQGCYLGNYTEQVVDKLPDEIEGKPKSASFDVTERLLEFQVDRMQKYGARVPSMLQQRFQELIRLSSGSSTMSHYARFLDDWYAGDYPSSLANLHRYYDYAMHNKDRSHYQYALLNMAILQADFGCSCEALTAISEAIAAARDSKDMSCLTFCLSWLHGFHPESEDTQIKKFKRTMLGSEMPRLRYLMSEARKYKMWSVESSAKLSEAMLCLARGHQPREVFERMYEASQLIVYHDITSVLSAELLVQSSVYSRLGIANTSTAYCDLISECYAGESPIAEMVRARCRSAYASMLVGQYTEASAKLHAIQPEAGRNLKISHLLAESIGTLKLKRALHNNDLRAAESLIQSLKAFPPSDLTFEIALLEINYLIRLRSLSTAFALIYLLSEKLDAHGIGADVYQSIRLLNAKAMLFVKAGRPQKGISLAMRAAAAAYRSKTLAVLWEAVGVLGCVLCGLQCYRAAYDLVFAIVFQAMEVEDEALNASLASTLCDAAVGLAATKRDDGEARSRNLKNARHWAVISYLSYIRIEDWNGKDEMMAKTRRIRRMIGGDETQEMEEEKIANTVLHI